jgi:hypothetical protein
MTAKLKTFGNNEGHVHWCPGCKRRHVIPQGWSFNNDFDKPTFQPSVRHYWEYWGKAKNVVCHYNITNGDITFHNDCTHALANTTVPLIAYEGEDE